MNRTNHTVEFPLGDYMDVPDDYVDKVVSIEFDLKWHDPEPDVGILGPTGELIAFEAWLDDIKISDPRGANACQFRWVLAQAKFGDVIDYHVLEKHCHEILNEAADEAGSLLMYVPKLPAPSIADVRKRMADSDIGQAEAIRETNQEYLLYLIQRFDLTKDTRDLTEILFKLAQKGS